MRWPIICIPYRFDLIFVYGQERTDATLVHALPFASCKCFTSNRGLWIRFTVECCQPGLRNIRSHSFEIDKWFKSVSHQHHGPLSIHNAHVWLWINDDARAIDRPSGNEGNLITSRISDAESSNVWVRPPPTLQCAPALLFEMCFTNSDCVRASVDGVHLRRVANDNVDFGCIWNVFYTFERNGWRLLCVQRASSRRSRGQLVESDCRRCECDEMCVRNVYHCANIVLRMRWHIARCTTRDTRHTQTWRENEK